LAVTLRGTDGAETDPVLTRVTTGAGNAADPAAAIVATELVRALWDAAFFPPLAFLLLGPGLFTAEPEGSDHQHATHQPGE
jgi:hypothetical protein